MLRKANKLDYAKLKVYRLIALLEILGKALEKIIATRLLYLAEIYNILLIKYTRGRKLTLTENALYILVKVVYVAWRTIDH